MSATRPDSSYLPRDVIQQEVARQLGELTNRVQAAEAENQQLRQRLTFMTEVGQATEGSTGDRVSGVGFQPLPSAVPTGQATQRPLRQQFGATRAHPYATLLSIPKSL